MKYIVVVPDGMSDRPLKELKGKTPLEIANKPNMDFIANRGNNGLLKTVYRGLPLDSGVANLSILGYEPSKYYPGRGPLEAANMKLEFEENDIALRCNIITEDNGLLVDYSAGHITTAEAQELIRTVNNNLGTENIIFYPGVCYRHVLLLKGNNSEKIVCQMPHDITGQEIEKNLIKPKVPEARETAGLLNGLMLKSKEILERHPVNRKRIEEGKNPGNMIWPWGPGREPRIPPFRDMFGLTGSLISAVDLLKGLAVSIGLEVIDVPGATGYLDTNYEGKADAAMGSLKKRDFVYIHIESTDEAGHEGSIEHKVQAIEDIDKRVIGRVLDKLEGDYAIGLLPDHATPISVRTHTDDAVPFAIYSTKKAGDKIKRYSEKDAKKGAYGLRQGTEFMRLLLE